MYLSIASICIIVAFYFNVIAAGITIVYSRQVTEVRFAVLFWALSFILLAIFMPKWAIFCDECGKKQDCDFFEIAWNFKK